MEASYAGRNYGPEWFEVVIDHEDLTETTVDTAQAFDILTQVAGKNMLVVGSHIEVKEAFDDTGDAENDSLVATLGDADDVDRLITAAELSNGASGAVTAAAGAAASRGVVVSNANGVRLYLTPHTGKALSPHDKGKMIVRVAAFFLG